MRILLVEDDPTIATFILKGLKAEGFAVDHASDGELGLDLAMTKPYAAAVAGRYTTGTLLAIQAITTAGILFLLENEASRAREAGFLLTVVVTILTTYGIFLSVKHFKGGSNTIPNKDGTNSESLFVFDPGTNVDALNQQIASLTRQIPAEKRRTTQLTLLNELSQQLESELDPPVAAQLAVNTLEKAMECSMASLLMHDVTHQAYVVLAAAGPSTNIIPPGYRQPSGTGLLGRTVRVKKTQVVHDTRLDPDFISLNNETTLSAINVPIIQHGHVQGVLEICSDKAYAFSRVDVAMVYTPYWRSQWPWI